MVIEVTEEASGEGLLIDSDEDVFSIQLFDSDKHNRDKFTCGVEQVDNYFKKTANKLVKARNCTVYVMTDNNGNVAGFYAMNAHAVDYQQLPKKYSRTRPGHGSIPAVYISIIGRDVRYSGKGIGGDLIVDALCRISRAAEVGPAIAVVMLDVLDCGSSEKITNRVSIYSGFGFQPLKSNPLRMFLPIAVADTLRRSLEAS